MYFYRLGDLIIIILRIKEMKAASFIQFSPCHLNVLRKTGVGEN